MCSCLLHLGGAHKHILRTIPCFEEAEVTRSVLFACIFLTSTQNFSCTTNSIFGLCSHSCKRQLIVLCLISDGSYSSHARQAATTQDCTDVPSACRHAVLIPSTVLTCLHQGPELAWGKIIKSPHHTHTHACIYACTTYTRMHVHTMHIYMHMRTQSFMAGLCEMVVMSTFGSGIKIGISL